MNILEKIAVWNQFKFQLPMIICAVWVIISQRKIITSTFKMWWSRMDLRNRSPERRNWMKIWAVAVVAFLFTVFTSGLRKELAQKQIQQMEEKLLEEKLITHEKLEKKKRKAAEKSVQKQEEKFSVKFFNFVFIVILAPIIEECIFRYLIFEIFNKNSPLPYIFSGLTFIFCHWGGGLLNFTTLGLLILTYLPATILFIYAYRKSKWNITYPIFFHFLWNKYAFWGGFRVI